MLAALPGEKRLQERSGSGALGRCSFASGAIGGAIGDAEGLLIALDGRILNARDLRAAGIDAPTGDAALLAALYRRHGFDGALRAIAGDFAVALLDSAS